MSEISTLIEEISASIWMCPCTMEELCKRDFLKDRSEYGISTLVNIGKSKGFLYWKKDIIHCYKKTVIEVLNPKGYQLKT